MTLRGLLISAVVMAAAPTWAQSVDENAPLSAIDWLSESVEQPAIAALAPPVPGTQANRVPDPDEAPVTDSASSPEVSMQPLGAPGPRALGLLDPATTGLPMDLWSGSDGATLAALLAAEEIDTLPALQDLIVTLAISRADPPAEVTRDAFFLARVDKLLDLGALEPARAMLMDATPDTPNLFRRFFDVSLLTGTEDAACRFLRDAPDVAPTPAARVFCLARSGDWSAAALTLNTGRALGDIDDATGELLARFLDPELFEGESDLPQPDRATPLTFRMFEAIGSPLSTQNLPRAFSHADLRDNVGWKAQLEAAERLARAGALPSNALIGLYTARVPAASGGVWERAKAVAALNTALASKDDRDIRAALTTLRAEARRVGVTVPLAQVFAPALIDVAGDGQVLFEWLLLSDLYEQAALNEDLAITDPFLAAVARGDPSRAQPSRIDDPLVRAAFATPADPALIAMATDGRTGEAILRAIATVQQGIDGDAMAFGEGIATLRALGLEDVARRTALQYLILR